MVTLLNKSEPRINRDSEAWATLDAEVAARIAAKTNAPFPDKPVQKVERYKREFVPEFEYCEKHGKYQINRLCEDGNVRWLPTACQICMKQHMAELMFANAEIPPRFRNCTFENYEAADTAQLTALGECQDYAANFDKYLRNGTCLILMGNPGTGKNHLSTAIARAVMDRGYTALRVKAGAYLNTYWSKGFGERDSWITSLSTVDLLMLDELGKTSVEKGANDAFFTLLDARYEQCKPTMLITNADRDGIVKAITQAGYDRLTQGGGKIVRFTWESHRRKIGAV